MWWFDDVAGVGTWRVRPFDGAEPGVPAGFPSGRAGGLAMAADGTVAVGLADDSGLAVYLRRPGEPVRLCTRTSGYAYLVDLSGDGTLVALAGEPDAADAVTVLDTTSGTRTTLAGSAGSVWAGGFAPGAGEPRLLLTVAHGAGYRIALWTRLPGRGVGRGHRRVRRRGPGRTGRRTGLVAALPGASLAVAVDDRLTGGSGHGTRATTVQAYQRLAAGTLRGARSGEYVASGRTGSTICRPAAS